MQIKNKIRYVTIFPECQPVHLKKDVGMLPYSLGKYKNYDFKIVCWQNEHFTEDEIKTFHINFVSNRNGDMRDFAKYIFCHGKEIDVLNLYHITSRRNILWIFIYRLVNPKGKIHLKLDADYRMVDLVDMHSKSFKGKLKANILRNRVDLYTVESEKMRYLLEEKWNLSIKTLPNGIYREYRIPPVLAEEKEKIFLTVGRLGTEQKATEDLLEAFYLISGKTDWDLWLVGSIETDFEQYIKEFFDNHPNLEKRIKLLGNISDAEKLTDIYRQASVFVLPSKWEGFALVLLESLECGNYLVLSDRIPSADDIGRNGCYASIVPFHQVKTLAEKMLEATFKDISDEILKERNEWIANNFAWQIIVDELNNEIKRLFTE